MHAACFSSNKMPFTFSIQSVHCDTSVDHTTIWYYISAGACGFGEYGRAMNWYDGRVAGVSDLWRNGAGCGTCYQVLTFLSLINFFSINNRLMFLIKVVKRGFIVNEAKYLYI